MGQVTWRQAPFSIAPGRKGVVFFPHVGDGVEAMASPWVAAAKARQSEPAALPRTILVDGLARIVRAGGQVPAVHAKEGRDRPAISGDGAKQRRFCRAVEQSHG